MFYIWKLYQKTIKYIKILDIIAYFVSNHYHFLSQGTSVMSATVLWVRTERLVKPGETREKLFLQGPSFLESDNKEWDNLTKQLQSYSLLIRNRILWQKIRESSTMDKIEMTFLQRWCLSWDWKDSKWLPSETLLQKLKLNKINE